MSDDKALVVKDQNTQMNKLLEMALDKEVPVEALEKLVALSERVQDRTSSQEFADAMSRFQEECPSISKTSRANIATKSGMRYSYNFADLDHIVKTIRPVLARHGLSFTWDSETGAGTIKVVCIISHVNGHKEQASFACPTESPSSQMSGQQKVAAALTFARRQSLVQALGLTTTEPDADGGESVGETITESQVADIMALADEVNADWDKFLQYLKVERIEDLPAVKFRQAVSALETKRRQP